MQADTGSKLLQNWIVRAAARAPRKPWVISASDGRFIDYAGLRESCGGRQCTSCEEGGCDSPDVHRFSSLWRGRWASRDVLSILGSFPMAKPAE